MQIMFIVLTVLLTAIIVLLIQFRPRREKEIKIISNSLSELQARFREDLRFLREEANALARDNRAELNNALGAFRQELMTTLSTGLRDLAGEQRQKLQDQTRQAREDNQLARDGLRSGLKEFREAFDKSIHSFNVLQREKFALLEERQQKMVEGTEKRLEQMRATVEEKLEKTLSERLGQSFETVGRQLIEVQKGLGEMQVLAGDVGSLKKVLSNVKIRGGMGEVQLALLLEQILAPGQYEANVRTRPGSGEAVEFAVRLPGREEDGRSVVYLPIDAKFPKDIYEQLLTAYERGLPEEIEPAVRNLENTIRKMARDIRDKYIAPPHTTDFAVLFLPFEGIYAEVIRRSGLIDQLQQEYKVAVGVPTTLAAYLNSLQMGFRTLALQQRSGEVWRVLGAVKTEFEKFGGLLEKAQKNIHSAGDTLDELLSKRTKAISRRLKSVESLPAEDARLILPDAGGDEEKESGGISG